MYNWNVDTKRLKKNPLKFKIWSLEQLINFGLSDQKLSKLDLIRNFDNLNIDVSKKNYLRFLLWQNQS